MTNKVLTVFFAFIVLMTIFISIRGYYANRSVYTPNIFTNFSVSSESRYIRHMSLSDVSNIYNISPEVIDIFPSNFVYSFSHVNRSFLEIKGEK